jgi:hypothetical protein
MKTTLHMAINDFIENNKEEKILYNSNKHLFYKYHKLYEYEQALMVLNQINGNADKFPNVNYLDVEDVTNKNISGTVYTYKNIEAPNDNRGKDPWGILIPTEQIPHKVTINFNEPFSKKEILKITIDNNVIDWENITLEQIKLLKQLF